MENIYKTPEAELASGQSAASGQKLFKISGIGVATFFGTVLAGGYLASRNLKSLGREEEAKKVLIWSAVALVAILAVAAFIPEDIPVPNIVFTVVQIVVMMQLAKKWFETDIDRHQESGGEMASNWLAFGISLLFMVAMLIALVGVVFLFI